MAGIGFLLQKLSKQDNLIGLFKAVGYAAIITAGPWIITIFMLALMPILAKSFLDISQMFLFKSSIIYNFSFSLVISAPMQIITTRYLADLFYKEDIKEGIGLLYGSLLVMLLIALPVGIIIYGLWAKTTLSFGMMAIINFLLLNILWIVSVFLSALRNYFVIFVAFLIGALVTLFLSYYLAKHWHVIGLYLAFSTGISLIIAILLGNIFFEYPFVILSPLQFLAYFKKYPELALGSFFGVLAVWIDKFIMWLAPEHNITPLLTPIYNHYDTAMFLAYLSILPALSSFIFVIETAFFEKYVHFFKDLQVRATWMQILKNLNDLSFSLFKNAYIVFILQVAITLSLILYGVKIFDLLGIPYILLGMFRLGLLGALFQIFSMFILIIISYFDNRMLSLKLNFLFLLLNATFSYASLKMGFAYYGAGFALAMIVFFVICAICLERYMKNLPFHTFITNNSFS